MKRVDVGKDFYHRLANRDKYQGDGEHNAVEFRKKYLKELDNIEAWQNDDIFIVFDFGNVTKIGPSFASEAFAHFAQYADLNKILEKIKFENITKVKELIIINELKAGYKTK